MLNQTNIGHNNNKFYVIQVIHQGNTYYLWNRWGRVVSLSSGKFSQNCFTNAVLKSEHLFESQFYIIMPVSEFTIINMPLILTMLVEFITQ